jgi:hypothetical protein
MVTLMWGSPLNTFSSNQFPESRVMSVICHHRLAQIRGAAAGRSGPGNPRATCQKPIMGTVLGTATSKLVPLPSPL